MLSRITCRAVIAAAFALALGGMAQANRAFKPGNAALRDAAAAACAPTMPADQHPAARRCVAERR